MLGIEVLEYDTVISYTVEWFNVFVSKKLNCLLNWRAISMEFNNLISERNTETIQIEIPSMYWPKKKWGKIWDGPRIEE